MEIELRFFDGCPNWIETRAILETVIDEMGLDTTVRTQRVETPGESEALGFRGSPTVLLNGEDPFADDDAPVGLTCRIYRTGTGFAGSPSMTQLRKAIAQRLIESG